MISDMHKAKTVLAVLGRLQGIRDEFVRLGFALPPVELRRIESVRTRGDDEKNYEFYSAERLLESLSFPGGRWRRSERDSIELAYRSKYIDLLCTKFATRDSVFGEDNSDTPAAYAGAMDVNADPNYLIYSRLDMINEGASRGYALENERLLDSEVVHFTDTLESLLGSVKSPTSKGVEKIFSTAAQAAGVLVRETGGHLRVLLEAPLSDDCSLYLDWDDDLVLRKWGRLQVAFSITTPGEVPDARSKVFRCSLDSFIPGGNTYTRTNGDILRVALGVFAHVKFMQIVVSFAHKK